MRTRGLSSAREVTVRVMLDSLALTRQNGSVASETVASPQPSEEPEADRPHKGDSGGAKLFRRVRWTVAFLIAALVLGAYTYWLIAGIRPACQVVTAGPTAQRASGTSTQTTTCGLPSTSDFVYVLAVVGLLLLPDAKSIGFGGFQFERLAKEVEQQTREIGQLRQQVSTTINIGADRGLLDEIKSGVRDLKTKLDDARAELPDDAFTQQQLASFDDVARRVDAASATELINAARIAQQLLEQSRRAAEEEMRRGTAVSPADVAGAVEALDVVRSILEREPDGRSASPLDERKLEG
jgi:hypothetical protein